VGTGDADGAFRISNSSNTYSALFGETNGSGPAIFGSQVGLGCGGQFQIQNPANAEAALRAYTDGTGRAGFFTINNPGNSSPAMFTTTNGSGPAIVAENTGATDGFRLPPRLVAWKRMSLDLNPGVDGYLFLPRK